MTTLALIDYGSGNIHSANRALIAAAEIADVTLDVQITADPEIIAKADRIVLPGVGHFADCAAGLRAQDGLTDALEAAVLDKARPFLGICVGMQLMADFGLEGGETRGLGWIHGQVDAIKPGYDLPVPHMGWNEISIANAHPVLDGLGDDPHVYFVHSYAYSTEELDHVLTTTEYGEPFTSMIGRDNIIGTQFHPEKSQRVGLTLLANFLKWTP